MSITGFDVLSARPNLLVRDIEASVAFYRDVLGFETKAMMGEPRVQNGADIRRDSV
ncbi:MAG: VOC family protein [Chloroflexi bacterium]|nr:VOC family protein [Chloroflexota bacterium]